MSRLSEILGDIIIDIAEIKAAEEIRISRNSSPFIITGSSRYFIGKSVSDRSFDEILNRICRNSYHTHVDTIKRGYINAGEGIRVGVCGRAVINNNDIVNLLSIDTLCIRIPHLIRDVSSPLFNEHRNSDFNANILVYSPPGVGKTTLLRDVALKLISPPYLKKISILDCREELYIADMGSNSLMSVYKGYPKEKALEASIRTMSADIIISDEIGSEKEGEEIRKFQNSGVSVIATAHASDIKKLLSRPFIRNLHDEGCFDIYCGISRKKGTNHYNFKIQKREEADECLKRRAYV